MPRAEIYHEQQKRSRYARKPYGYKDEDEVEEDFNTNGEKVFDMREMAETLEEETGELEDGNIFNPNGHLNNCVWMGLSKASGLPLDLVEERIDSPPPEDIGGITFEEVQNAAQQMGAYVSTSPPPEDYLENGGRAAVVYLHEHGGGHVVKVEGGNNERNMTYRDYQGFGNGEDVTEEVLSSEGRCYIYCPEEEFPYHEGHEDEGEDHDWR
jgi:hypothetical protein